MAPETYLDYALLITIVIAGCCVLVPVVGGLLGFRRGWREGAERAARLLEDIHIERTEECRTPHE